MKLATLLLIPYKNAAFLSMTGRSALMGSVGAFYSFLGAGGNAF